MFEIPLHFPHLPRPPSNSMSSHKDFLQINVFIDSRYNTTQYIIVINKLVYQAKHIFLENKGNVIFPSDCAWLPLLPPTSSPSSSSVSSFSSFSSSVLGWRPDVLVRDFVKLTQVGVTWGKGISMRDWPITLAVGKSGGMILTDDWCGRVQPAVCRSAVVR